MEDVSYLRSVIHDARLGTHRPRVRTNRVVLMTVLFEVYGVYTCGELVVEP